MSTQIVENVKGSDLPSSWQQHVDVDPDQLYTVTLIPQNDENETDEDMPPEEMLSDEIIEIIEKSRAEYQTGDFTRCKSKKEREAFFAELDNE